MDEAEDVRHTPSCLLEEGGATLLADEERVTDLVHLLQ